MSDPRSGVPGAPANAYKLPLVRLAGDPPPAYESLQPALQRAISEWTTLMVKTLAVSPHQAIALDGPTVLIDEYGTLRYFHRPTGLLPDALATAQLYVDKMGRDWWRIVARSVAQPSEYEYDRWRQAAVADEEEARLAERRGARLPQAPLDFSDLIDSDEGE